MSARKNRELVLRLYEEFDKGNLDRVVNGRIVEHRGLANEADFLRQLGGVPEKGTEESRNRAAS